MDTLKSVFLSRQLWMSVAVVIVSVAVWLGIRRILGKLKKRSDNSKTTANIRLFGNVLRSILLVLAVLTVLQINGINITSWLTGLGIVGIIVGFALQDILKDLIMGINIAVDHYYGVGDVVSYSGIMGEVVYLSTRITKIRDLDSGNVMTVSNRNISEIVRIEKRMVVHVPLPYGLPCATYDKVCGEIAERLGETDGITDCTYRGVENLGESAVSCVIYACGDPKQRPAHRRAANRVVMEALERAGLEVPFNRLDVHLDSEHK